MVHAQRIRAPFRRGFTILELLVTLTVIMVLLAILLPALQGARRAARSYKCQMALRAVSFEFAVFADDSLHGDRGDDDGRYGKNRFSLETFVESQYCIDEFWCFGSNETIAQNNGEDGDLLRCPEVSGEVLLRRNAPCREGAVGPTQNISYGFNSRLLIAEVIDSRGRPRVKEVQLTSAVLSNPRVPLVWDIDGEAAFARGSQPHFSAPSLDSRGPYASDRYWWPGTRHASKGNYALLDGSVHSSSNPEGEPVWDWSYQPIR